MALQRPASRFASLTVAGLLLGATVVSLDARPASADEISDLLRSPMAETFLESRAGAKLMARVLGSSESRVDFGRFVSRLEENSSAMRAARAEIEAQLRETSEALEDYRAQKSPDRLRYGADGALTPDEASFLRQLASRRLRVNPAWNPTASELRPGQIEFIPGSAAGGEAGESSAQRFLLAEGEKTPVFTAAQQAKGLAKAKAFVQELNDCVANMPPSQAKRDRIQYTLIQMGIDAATTATGQIMGSCSKTIEWKTLAHEVPTSMLWTAFSSQVMAAPARFSMRLLRVTGWGEGRVAFDGVLYILNPMRETNGKDKWEALKEREEWGSIWNATTPVVKVGLYTLLNGLQCVYPGAKMTIGATGIRYAYSTGSSIMFFKLRNKFTGHDALADCK